MRRWWRPSSGTTRGRSTSNPCARGVGVRRPRREWLADVCVLGPIARHRLHERCRSGRGKRLDDVRRYRPVYAGDILPIRVELVGRRAGDDPRVGRTRPISCQPDCLYRRTVMEGVGCQSHGPRLAPVPPRSGGPDRRPRRTDVSEVRRRPAPVTDPDQQSLLSVPRPRHAVGPAPRRIDPSRPLRSGQCRSRR